MSPTSFSIPSGVVDVAEGHVYVRGIGDRIECVSLESGAVEARADRTGLPVAAGAGVAIGWAPAVGRPGVEVFALERTDGTLVERWSRLLDLPDWVEVDADEAGRFVLAAAPTDDGAVTVRWNAMTRYGGGAPPSPDVEDAAGHAANGLVGMSIDSGEDEPVAATVTDVSQPTPPAIAPPDRLMSYRYRADRETRPWAHGTAEHFLVVRADTPGINMVTVNGADHGEVSITSDPAADVVVTIDGSLILLHEPSGDETVWRAINAGSGTAAGTVPFADGVMAAVRISDRLLWEMRREIDGADQHVVCVVALDADRPLWTHVLGESTRSEAPPLQP